jgi:hypothetical protein
VESDQRAAHVEPVALLGGREGPFGEDALADLVVVVVELLDGIEVAVHDHVEEPVEQEAHALHGKVG